MNDVILYLMAFLLFDYALFGLVIFLSHFLFQSKSTLNRSKRISFLIPFRNEKENLSKLISSIQKTNHEGIEFIFIDDHSTDQGKDIIPSTYNVITNKKQGKKYAILTGASIAKYDTIGIIDADSTFTNEYLQNVQSYAEGILLTGPIELVSDKKNIWYYFQKLESAAIQSVSAVVMWLKLPLMANGTNISYPKYILTEENIQPKVPSGDDASILEACNRLEVKMVYDWKYENIVQTQGVNSLKELYQQRIRWASKNKYSKNYVAIALGISLLLINLVVLVLFISIPFSLMPLNYISGFLICKLIIDILISLPYFILIKKPYLILGLPFLFVVYPFYFLIISIGSLVHKNYDWKDRVVKVKE